ncbi:MAG TPA: hypothetical protein VK255_01040 [Patescibacteria group bacterium]|nr:hypothetical protein [Patescibacteria group bacterium]
MDREITTLVAADGEQSGPRVITTYNPLTTIPLGQNIDEKGMRSEEVVFFSVSSFADAKSVFPSGELVVVEIRDCQAFIEDWYIPPELLMAWAYSNDLGSPNPELNFPTVKGLVNMTVPAALITLLLAKVSRFSIPLIG